MGPCAGRHEPLDRERTAPNQLNELYHDGAGRLDAGEAPSNPPGGGSPRLRPATAWAAPGRTAGGLRRIAGELEVAVEVGVGRRRVVCGRAAGLPPKRSGLGTSPHRRAEGCRLCAVASLAWGSLRPAPRCRPCPNGVLQQVRRAAHALAAAVEHMGVDHRRLDIPVAEELLDGPDVVAAAEEMGGEAVAKTVNGHGLGGRERRGFPTSVCRGGGCGRRGSISGRRARWRCWRGRWSSGRSEGRGRAGCGRNGWG